MSQQTYQPLDGFKQRELEVLHLIADGLTNEEIAARLYIEVTTVRWHNRQIYSKLGVHHRTLAVARARELGLLEAGAFQVSPETTVIADSLSNLPAQTTSFVGREREIAKVQQLLTSSRLLTLTGPGGTGKTRLALQVAEAIKDYYPDGVWFISLASVHDPVLVAGTIADVLKVNEIPTETIEISLMEHLHHKRMLLLIDNFEHVIKAVSLLSMLLAGAANVKLLVTSRELLRLYGEQEYPVLPLTVPDGTIAYSAQELVNFEAVRLFVERAQASRPGFQLTSDNADTAAQICARVDGLPLAIELAAARVKLLTPRQILSKLESGFETLGHGPRDVPTRQQTLRATIDWSYNLLSPEEKTLFSRLGIFREGWTLEAMEAICVKDLLLDIFDSLVALVDKSLIRQDISPEGELRFTMLETLREYAQGCLTAANEIDQLRERHARFYIDLGRSAYKSLIGSAQVEWSRRLQADYDNLRAAMEWAEKYDPTAGMELLNPLVTFWDMRGHLIEGTRWAERLLAAGQTVPPRIRMDALICASELWSYMGDLERGSGLGQLALELARRIKKPLLVARATLNLAINNLHRDLSTEDRRETQAMLETAVAIFRTEGDYYFTARALNCQGELARLSGEDDEARALYTEALQLFRAIGNEWLMTMALINLGFIALRQRDYEQASALYREAFIICHRLDDARGIAISVEGVAFVVGMTQDAGHAARLLGGAGALREKIGAAVQPVDQPDYEHYLAAIRTNLGADTFTSLWAEGSMMSLEQLTDELRNEFLGD